MDPIRAVRSADRVVVDIGNSRIKLGLLDSTGAIASVHSVPNLDPESNVRAWRETIELAGLSREAKWAIASVNPPIANAFANYLATECDLVPKWYRSAADVPISTKVARPEVAGADRALIALAGGAIANRGEPGLVISCGTALTIERVTSDGVWEGGVIAPGLWLSSRSLHLGTAQIPWVTDLNRRPAWGGSTESAVGAGVYWGTVGAARELIARQELAGWRIWTGGDAQAIATAVEESPRILENLVLRGLAMVAFGSSAQAIAR